MKVFHCDYCEQLLFFENSYCVNCGRAVAYLPDKQCIGSLEPLSENRWRSPIHAANHEYHLCRNYVDENICNWAIPADDSNPLCESCRTTQIIPNLEVAGNKEAWFRMESAKRRLFYSLLNLKLNIKNRIEDPEHGLAFRFLSPSNPPHTEVVTGHDNGIITINIEEADDAKREKIKSELGEPYRTLLGHFRHEIGHYFWDRLILDGGRVEGFRAMFGDERQDYEAALKRHYATPASANWQEHFVSAYASAHPWEDWAETWAHYLHMTDALETAAACGLTLAPKRSDEPALELKDGSLPHNVGFEKLIEDWIPLTYVLNNLNRGLGLPDSYPFILTTPVIEKLRFVHDTVAAAVVENQ